VAQGKGPEFKPQYHKIKKKNLGRQNNLSKVTIKSKKEKKLKPR
jgi:hypothetical protein